MSHYTSGCCIVESGKLKAVEATSVDPSVTLLDCIMNELYPQMWNALLAVIAQAYPFPPHTTSLPVSRCNLMHLHSSDLQVEKAQGLHATALPSRVKSSGEDACARMACIHCLVRTQSHRRCAHLTVIWVQGAEVEESSAESDQAARNVPLAVSRVCSCGGDPKVMHEW